MSKVKTAKSLRWAIGIAFVGACPGCERDFPVPPPLVEIQSFLPSEGYAGDRVTITGSNFDSKLENNIVFFGTVAARLETPTSNASDPNSLVALVPDLADAQDVFIKVSTAAGQTSSADAFSFLGPGHPRNEKQGSGIPLRARPVALTAISPLANSGGIYYPALLTNQNSHSLRMYFDVVSNWYRDLGTGDVPLSAAGYQTKNETAWQLVVYLVTLDGAFSTSAREVTFTFGLSSVDQIGLTPSDAPSVSIQPLSMSNHDFLEADFLPWQVRVFTDDAAQNSYKVVVTDLYRPKMIVLDIQGPQKQSTLVDFSKAASKCLSGGLLTDRLGPIADVVYLPTAKRFYVVPSKDPEIFSYEKDSPPSLVWSAFDGPPMGIPSVCSDYFSALAVDHSEQNLYAGYRSQAWGKSFLCRTSISQQDISFSELEYTPYALITAREEENDIRTEKLYLAVSNGMLQATLSPSGELLLEARRFISFQDSSGSPQALTSLAQPNSSDLVLLALGDSDRILFFQAGTESTNVSETPLGNLFPKVAVSGISNALYLTEPLTNVASVINTSSGLQGLQIPIKDGSYGAKDLVGLFLGGSDLLISPLPLKADQSQNTLPPTYDKLVVRKLASEAEIINSVNDWNINVSQGLPGSQDNQQKPPYDLTPFHDLLPAPRTSLLYMVSYGDWRSDPQVPGSIWAVSIDPQGDPMLTGTGKDQIDPVYQTSLEPRVSMVQLAPQEDALALYEIHGNQQVHVQVKRLADDKIILDRLLLPPACDFISDLAVRLSPEDQETATVYLALPQLGQVLKVVDLEQTTQVITTTGFPNQLFFSPDGRRLYATHLWQGKVSIIDVDCSSSPSCNQVIRDLAVPNLPNRVVFDRRGEKAFLTHLKGNQITVIE